MKKLFRNVLTLAVFLALLAKANAAVDVAFLVLHDSLGRPIELEPGNRFSHVALSVRGQWLHSYPQGGVQLSSSLQEYDLHPVILESEELSEPFPSLVQGILGRPYDFDFVWEDDKALYCTELVAKVLGIQPKPMTFEGANWPARLKVRRGALGLSPDELYQALITNKQWQELEQNGSN